MALQGPFRAVDGAGGGDARPLQLRAERPRDERLSNREGACSPSESRGVRGVSTNKERGAGRGAGSAKCATATRPALRLLPSRRYLQSPWLPYASSCPKHNRGGPAAGSSQRVPREFQSSHRCPPAPSGGGLTTSGRSRSLSMIVPFASGLAAGVVG